MTYVQIKALHLSVFLLFSDVLVVTLTTKEGMREIFEENLLTLKVIFKY